MKLLNLTMHSIDFTDGVSIPPSGSVASVCWHTEEFFYYGLTLVKMYPFLTSDEIIKIDDLLPEGSFGIVSFPVVTAARGTILEDRVGAPVPFSRKDKVAIPGRFQV